MEGIIRKSLDLSYLIGNSIRKVWRGDGQRKKSRMPRTTVLYSVQSQTLGREKIKKTYQIDERKNRDLQSGGKRGVENPGIQWRYIPRDNTYLRHANHGEPASCGDTGCNSLGWLRIPRLLYISWCYGFWDYGPWIHEWGVVQNLDPFLGHIFLHSHVSIQHPFCASRGVFQRHVLDCTMDSRNEAHVAARTYTPYGRWRMCWLDLGEGRGKRSTEWCFYCMNLSAPPVGLECMHHVCGKSPSSNHWDCYLIHTLHTALYLLHN